MAQSKSGIIRKSVYKAIDADVDLSDSSKRTEFENEFFKSHPGFECDRTLFVKIYKECFKNRNIDLAKVGLVRKKQYKFNIVLAEELQKKAEESREFTKPEPEIKPVLQIQDEVVINAITNNAWTDESRLAFFKCILSMFKATYPETVISEDTVRALSDMWIESFRRYGSEKSRHLALLALGTLSLLASKMYTGYKLHKESKIHK